MTEDDCRAVLERIRWPNGPECPHCGVGSPSVVAIAGKSHRPGLYLCSACRRQFTVTVGTPLEGTKLPLKLWIGAAHLLNSHQPIAVREIERALGVTYKTAWKVVQRLLAGVKNYEGPLRVFGEPVRAHLRPLRPDDRNTLPAWRRVQRKMMRGNYRAPRVPTALGALPAQFFPLATRAHLERTECFICWIIGVGKDEAADSGRH
ncbi:hypothetical protein RPB_0921 [Rhodopseudomonas palustris HaA2]|uniref:Transposase zinc-ribbon domain-containing protein n=1 Tax=Rhodopseudomonas palustris (strain HaA2) TaxID=316058 RepID=Q2J1M8_RHOP2|nr:hypothetical protein RPB_0921 [Rhodopseudomonas palustris HaA2]